MSSKHTVEVAAGERITSFHIKPPITLGKLVGLPNPKKEPDSIDVLGLYVQREDASVLAYQSEHFGPENVEAVDFAAQIADHLGAPVTNQTPPATA